ncbi:MAG: glycoside hydrolase family 53 protein [Aeromonadaceae bacterium]
MHPIPDSFHLRRAGTALLLLLTACLTACGGGGGGGQTSGGGNGGGSDSGGATPVTLAIRGVDMSMLEQVEQAGGRFQQNGTAADGMQLMHSNGANLVRLRLWVDPQSASGVAYGGGDSDLARVTRLAKRAQAAGMNWMLDLHYSDFWTDPGKQVKPKAWASLGDDELVAQVQSYSQQVMSHFISEGVAPAYVQVGNELNSGMLWPTGKNWAANGETVGGFDMLARLLKAGIAGVRSAESQAGISTPAKVILHLAKGGDNGNFRWWFDEITRRNVDFDIIGVSYYPYWHGSLTALKDNLSDVSSRYGKPVLVVETAYAFTLENGDNLGNNFGTATEVAKGGYPATPAGQQQFLKDLRTTLAAVPNGQALGFVYWEPDWLPVDATWASDAGMSYIGENGNVGNAWENQALFDYHGDALPALGELAASR